MWHGLLALSFILFLVDLQIGPLTTNLLGLVTFGAYITLSPDFSISRRFLSVTALTVLFFFIIILFHIEDYSSADLRIFLKHFITVIVCAMVAYNFVKDGSLIQFRRAFWILSLIVVAYVGWLCQFQPSNLLAIRMMLSEGEIALNSTVVNFSIIGVIGMWLTKHETSLYGKLGLAAIVGLMLLLVLASASRQSALTFVVGAVLVIGVIRFTLISGVVALIAGSFLSVLLSEHFSRVVERFQAVGQIGGIETHAREQQYQIAWELFTRNPVFGSGISAFEVAIGGTGLYTSEAVTESSLSYLITIGGLFGFFLYLMLFVLPVVMNVIGVKNGAGNISRAVAIPLSFVFAFSSLFNENFFSSGPWVIYFVTLALYLSHTVRKEAPGSIART